jgi:hypothetical protein
MRWSWPEKTDSSPPWSALPVQVPDKFHTFFVIAMQTEIGDGTRTRFWSDRWLNGH